MRLFLGFVACRELLRDYIHPNFKSEEWPFRSLSDPRFARGSGQVVSKGNVIIALPTRSDARDVLKFHVSHLYPVLGCPHVPARRKVLRLRLGDELPDNLGFRGSKLLDELLKLGL
jgi:hypothetical protein